MSKPAYVVFKRNVLNKMPHPVAHISPNIFRKRQKKKCMKKEEEEEEDMLIERLYTCA